MKFTDRKARTIATKLDEWRTIDRKRVDFEYIECNEYKVTNTPPAKDAGWKEYKEFDTFTGKDNHYWLHTTIKTEKADKNKEIRFSVKTGRESLWDATNPQFTVYVNGVTTQALDTKHTWFPLEQNKEYDIYLYLYTGMEGGRFEVEMTLDTVDLRIESLYYDINVPCLCMSELNDSASTYMRDHSQRHDDILEFVQIRDCLDKAVMKLDLRDIYSDAFYKSIDETAKYLKEEFYGKICGKTEKKLCCVGHTHIDVAWMWTVAQTREKAQRSFSTVLNMMNKYDDYIFMSSQPQLYQHVKESDPELYERIKHAMKDGKWEADGAMWLESDTNLVSGESLIRQLIYGKRFLKEEFDVDSKILWLPDVFGYSGALPQILKVCGVDKFYTTKMMWNDTNPISENVMEWVGIDGTSVFALLMPGYCNVFTPKAIMKFWNRIKNRSVNEEGIMVFGYADGGGGPTYDMLETYKRMKYGIPGMPKTEIMTVNDYFEKTQKEFEKNTSELKYTPKWVGEMYLEFHRGVYTSMAKNKKNNRKSELLYLSAENASVADMVLNGSEYPSDIIKENTYSILLNQFHDIIPGTCIKEVYDVTDVEYEKILKDGRNIIDSKLNSIKNNLKTNGGIFVYNPSPFITSGCVEVDGNTYYAENVPSHGWKVIEDKKADCNINVSKKSIENELVKVTFDDNYHVISVFDKEENREVIKEGAKANQLEVYEDYPSIYDAWELENYYTQKKWIADDVSNVELLKNGIRVERKYGKSTIKQDIVLNKNSKRIDFKTTVDWKEDHVFMKATFPVDISNTNATYDIQFGNVERPTHKNTSWDMAKFEVCAHKWFDLSEANYGVSILNDSKYGCNVDGNVMGISLLKAPTYPNPNADREIHEFTYSLYPHNGDFRQGKTVVEGFKLNMPLEADKIGKTKGTISDNYSLVSCDKENVVVETIKKAEDDSSIIVRMHDEYNQKTEALITLGFDFERVYLCDALENNIKELSFDKNTVKVPVKNFEIVTLKFER